MKSIAPIQGQHAWLRPLAENDATFLFELRNDAELTRFVNDGPRTLEQQQGWMRSYFGRDNDLNYVVISQSSGTPVGTVALYDIDGADRHAEQGRWLVRQDSLAAVEADFLLNRHAFETFGLHLVHFSVCALNAKVLRYHIRCGARWIKSAPAYFQKQGVPYDSELFELSREAFQQVKKPMLEKALYRRISTNAHA